MRRLRGGIGARERPARVGVGMLGTLVLALVAVVWARPTLRSWIWPERDRRAGHATATVRRADLRIALTAGGRVESSKSTVVKCDLESLEVRVRGQGTMAGGLSTILSVVDDGTTVRAGDVLCALDASDYEEMVRQQEIVVARTRAEHRQAELDLDVARLAVVEFRDGLMKEDLKAMRGQLALARSDQERLADRLDWSRRMAEKGYLPLSQLSADAVALRRAELLRTQAGTNLDLYQRFRAPKELLTLGSQIKSAEAMMGYQDLRLGRHEERLAALKRQVERCTIRAPHDGFVIYANVDNRDVRIEPGATVRQRQDLFYLPDLSSMQVQTMIHESVLPRIHAGQRARVQVEGLPDRVIEGRLGAIAQLPGLDWSRIDVRFFMAVVQLDHAPGGLKPGMTAEVEIETDHLRDVLTVPPEALAVEEGHDVCYVAHEDGVERRSVTIGQATRDLLEVTEGLAEGESVVLDPGPAQPVDPD